MTQTIQLSCGLNALVDDEDFERLSQVKWAAIRAGTMIYAVNFSLVSGRRKSVRMHRAIMGAEREQFVDHKNGDTLDNRRENLRLCTRTENNRNKARSLNKLSQFKGVYRTPRRDRWFAQICVNYNRIYLGSGADEAVVARLYDTAAVKHFGEFACLNFPEEHGLTRAA